PLAVRRSGIAAPLVEPPVPAAVHKVAIRRRRSSPAQAVVLRALVTGAVACTIARLRHPGALACVRQQLAPAPLLRPPAEPLVAPVIATHRTERPVRPIIAAITIAVIALKSLRRADWWTVAPRRIRPAALRRLVATPLIGARRLAAALAIAIAAIAIVLVVVALPDVLDLVRARHPVPAATGEIIVIGREAIVTLDLALAIRRRRRAIAIALPVLAIPLGPAIARLATEPPIVLPVRDPAPA
ncbi:MAG: hypothetical protein M3680_16830, partial [Myxococcota bacterium]|nr:hypothetical protein [Myxococcota bacterium]